MNNMDTKEAGFANEIKVEIDQFLHNQKEKAKGITEPSTERNFRVFSEKKIQPEYVDANSVKIEGIEIENGEHKNSYEIRCRIQKEENTFEDEAYTDEYVDKTDFVVQQEIDNTFEVEEKGQYISRSPAVSCEKEPLPTNEAAHINNFFQANTRNQEPPTFQCVSCSYQTPHKRSISCHVLSHMPKDLKCPHCPYKSNKKDRLEEHLLGHTSKAKLYKCSKCPFASKWRRCLGRHLVLHEESDENPDESSRKSCLQTHQKGLSSCLEESESGAKLFPCSECSFKTKYKQYLKLHKLKKHNPRAEEYTVLFRCYMCTWTTFHKYGLSRHIKTVHGGAEGGIDDRAELP